MRLAVGDQPATDAFGYLGRRSFWDLGRVLSVSPDPVPPSDRLPDEFDAVCLSASLLQADANVGWDSRHDSDPPDVVSVARMVQ